MSAAMGDAGSPPPRVPEPPSPPNDSYVPPPPPERSGCLTAFMVLVGIILLLPGLCAALFSVSAIFGGQFSQVVSGAPIIIFGLLVGFGGIMLIRAASRGSRS
jgi:hypothetical protein